MMGGVVSLFRDLGRLGEDGNYTCTASNSLGNSSRELTVRVRSKQSWPLDPVIRHTRAGLSEVLCYIIHYSYS